MSRLIHWRYLTSEMTYRWKRAALLVGGIALAATLVVMLDVLGRAFADVATVPFRNLGAGLIVQRSATASAVPKEMGIMLPYSAQPITPDELGRLAAEPVVTQAAGFVLLWNLGAGRFYSISGIPLGDNAPALGPGRVREWLYAGRLPIAGKSELLVERHYGAFYRLEPGSSIDIGGKPFSVVGVVEIKEGSQIAASNFYMDIDQARALASLPRGSRQSGVPQGGRHGRDRKVKRSIAAWLPRASIASPGTMLQLFGGVSQTIGRFGPVAVVVGTAAALALSAMLVLGVIAERRRELAVLRVLGWHSAQVRRQLAVEMAVQGLLGGLLALALVALGVALMSRVAISLPATLSGENPVNFAHGGFKTASSAVNLPIATTIWDWVGPVAIATLGAGLWGWLWSAESGQQSLWAAIKS